jgi:uncharacterized membrane protein YdfJ with MMPL/SSD domain
VVVAVAQRLTVAVAVAVAVAMAVAVAVAPTRTSLAAPRLSVCTPVSHPSPILPPCPIC